MVHINEWIKLLWLLFISILLIFSFLRLYLTRWWERRDENIDNKFNPDVKVIIPCKGLDIDIENNIKSVLNQKYSKFKVIGVVDEETDPAYKILKNLGVNILITDNRFKGSGKVRAISTALSKIEMDNIVVLVDSDTSVGENWLSYLINPLRDENVGAVSTYPYYVPVEQNNFWGYVKKIWGYLGINMMEFKPARFVWGGSVAFRRSLLDGDNFRKFSESVSDDATITYVCKEKGLSIAYSRMATPIVKVRETRGTFMEWSNRQMAISLSYAKYAFVTGILMYGIIISYVLILIPLSIFVWNLFALGYVPYLFAFYVNVKRDRSHIWKTLIITLIMPFIFMENFLRGRNMAHIEWRGVKYSLKNK